MDEPTQDWAVTLTYAAAPEEQDLLSVEDLLETWSAAVTGAPPDRVMVTLHLPAADPLVAVEAAQELLRRSCVTAGLIWPQVGVEAVSEEEYERRAEAPTLPELVGASEVGAMLGVSRQRVHQLRDQPSFPAPLVEVAMGPLWDARAIEAFARTWSRRPGRPPLVVASG